MRVPVSSVQQQHHPVPIPSANNRRFRSRSQYLDMADDSGIDKGAATARPSSTSPAPTSASGSASTAPPELPSFLLDPVLNRTYACGRYLGKGGFAWCYEVTDVRSHAVFALKVVPKTRVVKQRHRNKVLREISIHHPLRHPHIVRLYSAFEDDNNIYMVLELCQLDSLVSVMKKRKTLSEYETRYYMMQLLTGVQYLHGDARVLHRDLKLGNMLLTDQMQVKIADFGLAAEMGHDGCDHYGQVCGTPNYISPEVLRKEGHSSASEAWAMGCIMYAMLVGKPPFETTSLNSTYSLILACQYSFPSHVRLSSSARDLMHLFLHPNPGTRPTPAQAMAHDFFAAAIPITLPVDACQTAPNLAQSFVLTGGVQSRTIQASTMTSSCHRIRQEVPPQVMVVRQATTATATYRSSTPLDVLEENRLALVKSTAKATTPLTSSHHLQGPSFSQHHVTSSQATTSPYSSNCTSPPATSSTASNGGPHSICAMDSMGNITFGSARENALTQWLYEMYHSLNETLYFAQGCRPGSSQVAVSTKKGNVLYVTKWIDYSNRYGFGCQFNNGGVSIMQNDRTRLCLSADRRYCRRWQSDRNSNGCVAGSDLMDLWAPATVGHDSMEVIRHFVDYMDTNLMTGGFSDAVTPLTVAVPFIVLWRRFSEYLLIILSDGTFQINFISLHTKVVLSRLGGASSGSKCEVGLTFIDESRLARTCPLTGAVQGNVIDQALLQRVRDLLGDYVLTPSDCFTAEI